MENKTLELKIPEKVSDHQYVIQGIGKQEMTILIIQFLGAIGLIIVCAIAGNTTAYGNRTKNWKMDCKILTRIVM